MGECRSREEVLQRLAAALPSIAEGSWLCAVHYDQTRFADGMHLTRDELDGISADVPIFVRHVNGHAAVANSAALSRAGVDERTPDPKGGTYVRDEAGRPNGVLLETALGCVDEAAPLPTLDQMVEAILLAGDKMAENGIVCAADMMTGAFDLEKEIEAYRLAAERGMRVATRLYLQWAGVFGPRATPAERLRELIGGLDGERCRVAGVKIFADGAIGSATAAIYGEFTGGGSGQLIYTPERLTEMVRTADDAGWQIAIHSIGDRSTDLVMDAYERLDQPARHRIEHVMMLNDGQIERLAKLGCHCTMQPEFLEQFGHSYRRQLGPERAARLKRARSLIQAGVPLSFSSDRPIVPGDPEVGVRCLTRRPEGFDQTENISLDEAIRGYTVAAEAALLEPAAVS